MYEFYVRKKIETALKNARNGRLIPHEEVKNRFSSFIPKLSDTVFPKEWPHFDSRYYTWCKANVS
jgi:hypothetical protein